MFPGALGIAIGVGIFSILFLIAWRASQGSAFIFERDDGQFERLLAAYLDIAKFIVGLAAGGIVLVVSSTAIASSMKKLPASYASPLFLLAMSVFYGVLFMPLLAVDYEAFKQRTRSYSKFRYVRNQALGFSTLACFCVGYGWLIWAAVNI